MDLNRLDEGDTGGLARAWVALLVTREPLVYYACAAVLFAGREQGAEQSQLGLCFLHFWRSESQFGEAVLDWLLYTWTGSSIQGSIAMAGGLVAGSVARSACGRGRLRSTKARG